MLISFDWKFLYVNEAAARHGYQKREHLVGRSMLEMYPGMEDSNVFQRYKIAMEERIPQHFESAYTFPDGTTNWYELSVEPVQEGIFVLSLDITERRNTEIELRRKSDEIEKLLKVVPVAVWLAKERDCNSISGNDAAGRLFEQDADANFSPDSNPGARRYFSSDGRELSSEDLPMQLAISGNMEIENAELEVLLPSGKRIFIMGNAIPLRDESGQPRGSVAAFLDITDLKKAASELRIAATAIESQEGIVITDRKRSILRVNHAFAAITGHEPEDAMGRKPDFFGADLDEQAEALVAVDGKWTGEKEGWDRSGMPLHMLLTVTAVADTDGSIANYVYTFIDISSKKRAEAEIAHLAFHDQLTGLPNRRLMKDRLDHAQATSLRSRRHCALLLLDLDNFKTLNDTQGHAMGDLVLAQAASRLEGCVREEDTVSRFGGDEFMVLLEELNQDLEEATLQVARIGEKIRLSLDMPYRMGDLEIGMTCSIGATLFVGQDHGREDFVQQADIALYQAKKDGRNAMRFFDKGMQESINASAALERDLRRAIGEGQFRLHCQAQVDPEGRLVGAEALLRWDHPEKGLVGPDEFIPLAEESRLILDIGKWVIEAACERLSSWKDKPEAADLVLSVNVSVSQLRQASFVEEVEKAIVRHGIDPRLLGLEVTESMLLEDGERAMALMNALKDIGVRLSLDDFGMGYSSFFFLKRIPFDQLKIDRTFIADIERDENDRGIVQAIIAMAKGLGLEVVAEGVETAAQRDFLYEKGCRILQGRFFGEPLPMAQFESSMKQH